MRVYVFNPVAVFSIRRPCLGPEYFCFSRERTKWLVTSVSPAVLPFARPILVALLFLTCLSYLRGWIRQVGMVVIWGVDRVWVQPTGWGHCQPLKPAVVPLVPIWALPEHHGKCLSLVCTTRTACIADNPTCRKAHGCQPCARIFSNQPPPTPGAGQTNKPNTANGMKT